jgi:hypothetical protein
MRKEANMKISSTSSADINEASLPTTDLLDSWKEIANFLGREVRTVQLWEKREGLPVHRHFHVRRSSVHAYRSELVAWQGSRIALSRKPPVQSGFAKLPHLRQNSA